MDFRYLKNSPIHKIPFDTKLNNLLRFKLIVNEITSSLIHSNFDQIYFSLSPWLAGRLTVTENGSVLLVKTVSFSAPELWTQTQLQTLEHKYLFYVEDEAHHTHFPSLAL